VPRLRRNIKEIKKPSFDRQSDKLSVSLRGTLRNYGQVRKDEPPFNKLRGTIRDIRAH
jgi:hypothetical protein